MPDYIFGEILKKYRADHDNMSQQELANILGTTKQVISRYETGQRDPKISIAAEYAEKLGVPLSQLLGDNISLSEQVSQFSPDKLSEIRSSRGLSLFDCAHLCDISTEEYAEIEAGHKYPTDLQVQQIALALHTSLDELYSLSWSFIYQNPSGVGFQRLTELEYQLLMLFRSQPSEGKSNLLSFLKKTYNP